MFRILLSLTLLHTFTFNVHADAPTVRSVEIEKAFLVRGFDSDDLLQIVVTGAFPSTCYKLGTADVWVDPRKERIEITHQAYVYDRNDCLRMRVPFQETINIGVLEDGSYTVIDGKSKRRLGTMPIAKAGSGGVSTDDYLYAPVDNAYIYRLNSSRPTLVLRGRFNNKCLGFEDIKISYQKDVLVVQPIIEKKDSGCKSGRVPFEKRIKLRKRFRNDFLLHVRTLSGGSINRVYSP